MLRAIIISALILTGSAAASADCATVEQVKQDMVGSLPLLAHLDEKNSQPFLAAASAHTKTQLSEKEVLVFGNNVLAYVVLFKDGCAAKQGRFPADMVDKWLHGLGG